MNRSKASCMTGDQSSIKSRMAIPERNTSWKCETFHSVSFCSSSVTGTPNMLGWKKVLTELVANWRRWLHELGSSEKYSSNRKLIHRSFTLRCCEENYQCSSLGVCMCVFAERGLTCWPPRCLLLSPRHAAAGFSAWLFMQKSKQRTELEASEDDFT